MLSHQRKESRREATRARIPAGDKAVDRRAQTTLLSHNPSDISVSSPPPFGLPAPCQPFPSSSPASDESASARLPFNSREARSRKAEETEQSPLQPSYPKFISNHHVMSLALCS